MGRIALPAVLAAFLTGCALAPTYDSKIAAPLAAAGQGNVEDALRALDAKAQGGDKADLLINLERGELLRVAARFQDSLTAFEVADVKVNAWEATAKTAPEQLMDQVAATFVGETFKTYEGQDYEKVMLTTRMAMDRISLGDLDTARIDIKRTHEREAVITEFRAKETYAAEEQAKQNGVVGQAKELNGYPIETLNDPDVLQLRNGYQNALSHYLAGYVYEALNEPSLAAPGYRKAIELRPGLPILEEGLRGLDERTSARGPKGVTDVLFILEAGSAPARKSQWITFPIPSKNGIIVVPLAYPVIYPNKAAPAVEQVSVNGTSIPAALVADFNVMARRTLKDELPGVQLRAAIRAIGKGVVQEQLNRKSVWLGLIGNVAAVATESPADDRMWRSLPERVFVARAFLPPGAYELRVPGLRDEPLPLVIEGRYMVVPVRVMEARTYYAQPMHFGQVAAVEPPPPQRPVTAVGKGSAKAPSRAAASAPPNKAATGKSANSKAEMVPADAKASTAKKTESAKADADAKASGDTTRKTTMTGPDVRAAGTKPVADATSAATGARATAVEASPSAGAKSAAAPPKRAAAAEGTKAGGQMLNVGASASRKDEIAEAAKKPASSPQ